MTGPSADATPPKDITPREHQLWFVCVILLGIWLPGAGLMLALVLSLTRLQKSPAKTRWTLIGVGGALMLLDQVSFSDSSVVGALSGHIS